MSLRKTIILFVVLSFVSDVLCIKCWSCRSNDDPKCADPFDNSTIPITDCEREKGLSSAVGSSVCRKIRQKVNGEWLYIRDCADLGEVGVQDDGKMCVMKTGTDNILTEYCTCNSKDGCNSSTLASPLSFCLTIFAAFISIVKLYNL